VEAVYRRPPRRRASHLWDSSLYCYSKAHVTRKRHRIKIIRNNTARHQAQPQPHNRTTQHNRMAVVKEPMLLLDAIKNESSEWRESGDELVESKCSHKVCEVEDRQHTCMIRSGEVLREYSDHGGGLMWAVYPRSARRESHCVIAWDVNYGHAVGELLWMEYANRKGDALWKELVCDGRTLEEYGRAKGAELWDEYAGTLEEGKNEGLSDEQLAKSVAKEKVIE
jgi:hypothetical protein